MFQRLAIAAAGVAVIWLAGCGSSPEGPLTYSVHRAPAPVSVDGCWNKPVWQAAPTMELTHYMGDRPEHFPRTQAKLLYDESYVYVIFRVEDRYVRAVCQRNQGPVCRDTCAEFFFTPGTDIDAGYFNIEMNCGGTTLASFQRVPRGMATRFSDADLEKFKIAHSLPRIVQPEITEPTVWTLEYAFPTDLPARYYPAARKPAPGVIWRANVYKCADASSHPHWLTWSRVDLPKPDFHCPAFFGTLVFK